MSDIHIDDFYRDVAKIFVRLYAQFPRKITLYVDDISGPDEPDEFGLHHPRYEACFSAMVWLAEEGYLRFEEAVRQDALDQAVLTRRGFLLLASRSELGLTGESAGDPPSVARRKESNIAQLRLALQDGGSHLVQRCVAYLLSLPAPGGERAD